MCMDQWNIIEGHGRIMTKGNEVGKEYYLSRTVFDRKGSSKDKVYRKEKGLPYGVLINV